MIGTTAQVPFPCEQVRVGATDDKLSDVHVGSPRYMREEACFNDTTYDDLDPIVRQLLSTDEFDADAHADIGVVGEPEGGDGATGTLSVRGSSTDGDASGPLYRCQRRGLLLGLFLIISRKTEVATKHLFAR